MDKIKQVLNKIKLILLDYFLIVKLLLQVLIILLGLSIIITAYLSLPIIPFFIKTSLFNKLILSFLLFLFQLYILEIIKELFKTLSNKLLLK
ncbi:MAG: hypothetical protein ACO2O4_05035 [Minisyncoccia bacterium]|jgi:hypothetical protein